MITAGSWNDRWDVSVGSMTDTVDREKLFYFTPAYYYTPAVIVGRTATTRSITGPADLTGKTVCVGVSTTYQDYVQGDSGARGRPRRRSTSRSTDAKLQTYDTDTDALDNLALGDGVRCDAAISAQQTIQAFIDDGGAIKIVGDPLYYEPLVDRVRQERPDRRAEPERCRRPDRRGHARRRHAHRAVGEVVRRRRLDGLVGRAAEAGPERTDR